ncbi:hypothetical protein D3C87_1750740 [compost metagenome]
MYGWNVTSSLPLDSRLLSDLSQPACSDRRPPRSRWSTLALTPRAPWLLSQRVSRNRSLASVSLRSLYFSVRSATVSALA